jgi:hypothetical protein
VITARARGPERATYFFGADFFFAAFFGAAFLVAAFFGAAFFFAIDAFPHGETRSVIGRDHSYGHARHFIANDLRGVKTKIQRSSTIFAVFPRNRGHRRRGMNA